MTTGATVSIVNLANQPALASSGRTAFQLTPDDCARIRAFGALIVPRLPEVIERFYAWLRGEPEYARFFDDAKRLKRVQDLQVDYWRDFFRGAVDDEYIERRQIVGEVHARAGLPLPLYFAAVHVSLEIFMDLGAEGMPPAELPRALRAVHKLLHLDTSIVVETYSNLTSEIIRAQSKSLMEMSTPVTSIWDGILMLPVVGIVDSKRAQDIRHAMLSKIATTQARIVVLDISGVGVVDTQVANHLIKITKATKLMGCECLISGVSPAIAETIVDLGIEVGQVHTTANLQDALRVAFARTGTHIGARA